MATWQFHSLLLPHVPFKERLDAQTLGLPCDENDWPDEKVAQAVLADIAQILPEDPHNWRGENGKAWGNSAINDIQADFPDGRLQTLYFRVDLRTLPVTFSQSLIGRVVSPDKAPPTRAIDFIEAIFRVAWCHDLLFCAEGRAIPPQIPALSMALKNSMAFRYVSDPEDFLNRLKQIQ